MLSRLIPAVLFVAVCIAAPHAQGAEQRPAPQAPTTRPPSVTPAPQPAPPPQSPAEPSPRGPRGKDLNVQIEITITDQTGTGAPEKKTVSLLVADQSMGRVRANARANKVGLGFVGTALNVDARPAVLENERILLDLTLEYQPLKQSDTQQEPTNLNESISVILTNGKALTISQAADPISDRRMTVEVKATISK
jgi:hypothetical protein